MQRISNMRINKFINKELLETYAEQVENMFKQATEIGFSEGE